MTLKEMFKGRNVQGKKCSREEMFKEKMFKGRNVQGKKCSRDEMFKGRNVQGKKCSREEMFLMNITLILIFLRSSDKNISDVKNTYFPV